MEKLSGLWLAFVVAEGEDSLVLYICTSGAIAKITLCIRYIQVWWRLHAMQVPKVQRTVLICWYTQHKTKYKSMFCIAFTLVTSIPDT